VDGTVVATSDYAVARTDGKARHRGVGPEPADFGAAFQVPQAKGFVHRAGEGAAIAVQHGDSGD